MKKCSILLMAIVMLIGTTIALSAHSVSAKAESLPNPNLLMIVDDGMTLNSTDLEFKENIEITTKSKLSLKDNHHLAYALHKDIAITENIRPIITQAYKNLNARIYIYGGLTISNYEELLHLNDSSISINTCNEDESISSVIHMSFDKDEKNKVNQIICLSKEPNYQSLVVSGNAMNNEEALSFIVEHYKKTFYNPLSREAIIVNSSYSHTIWASNNYYLNIDYILYKDNAESDINYDYFALKTNVTGCSKDNFKNCREIQVKHQLVNSSDNVTDYAPKDIKRATNVNVGLSYGPTASASIGISFGINEGPTIDSTYTPADKTVKWKVSKYWFFGKCFTGEMFTFGSSWATMTNPVSIKISTYGNFDLPHNFQTNTGWDTQDITFYY